MLGGPRHRKQWEGRRKWLRGASWNLKKVENVILPSVMRDGDGDGVWGGRIGGYPWLFFQGHRVTHVLTVTCSQIMTTGNV